MRTVNNTLIDEVKNMSWTSDAIHVGNAAAFSIQAFYTSSSATVKLQASNDKGSVNVSLETVDSESNGIENWSDLDNSEVSITENGDILYDVENVSYKWVRIVFTGTGTVDSCRFNLKG